MTKALLFIVVFHVILLGSLIPIFKNRDNFNFIAKVLAIILLVQFLLNLFKMGTPVHLLYGPFVLLLYKSLYNIRVHRILLALEILPFLFFMVLYTLSEYGSPIVYDPYYAATSALSSFCYGVGIFLYWRVDPVKFTRRWILIYQMSFMNIVASVFILVIILEMTSVLPENLGSGIGLFLHIALLLGFLFVVQYFVIESRGEKAVPSGITSFQADVLAHSNDLSAYQKMVLNKKTFLEYEIRVREVLVEQELYLSPELSLDKLAQVTDIPKHHFSQLFSVYLKTSFYQLVAQHRIAHAIRLLDEGTNITVESLAYECGFNSKTSFNRYFKDITGSTPSEYQNLEKTPKV